MSLLIKNAELVVTMDDSQREIPDFDVLIQDNVVQEVCPNLNGDSAEVIDARGCLVIPGLIRTHNHSFETVYRSLPLIMQTDMSEWFDKFSGLMLRHPYMPDAAYAAALANFGEMLLTGCTTSADHHWAWHRSQPPHFIDRAIDAALEIGIRYHPSRGSLSLDASRGGLVPEELVESEDSILEHAQGLIEKYHDPRPFSLIRIVLAPTGIFADSEEMYRETRALAQEHPGVHCHTHLNEVIDDDFCVEKYGIRPLDFMERVGWVGEQFLFYHVATPTAEEVKRLAATGSFISICNAVDIRMGYGLAPVRELLDLNGNLCFGTSGACANYCVDMVGDLRISLLANRLRFRESDEWVTARELLRLATVGDARGLGRDDIGSIEPGKAADISILDLQRIGMAGYHDPVATLLMMGGIPLHKSDNR